MRTADRIMAGIQERHARRMGREAYQEFKNLFVELTEHQRRYTKQKLTS